MFDSLGSTPFSLEYNARLLPMLYHYGPKWLETSWKLTQKKQPDNKVLSWVMHKSERKENTMLMLSKA